MLRLAPMTEAEFEEYERGSVAGYAESKVRAGAWRPEGALERARAEHARLVPEGPRTPGHFFRSAFNERGERVGEVWYALRDEGRPVLFIFWLGVREAYRRRGHATELLHAVSAEARRLGADQVVLHVFGDNATAISVYQKAGFRTTDLIMARDARA